MTLFAWLYQKTKDPELFTQALCVAGYSYGHRDPRTGLVINEPDKGRWDAKVCTTEIGVWAQSMLRSARYASHDEFVQMARNVIKTYLKYGYDNEKELFYGQLSVTNGKPVIPKKTGYWPPSTPMLK